MTSLAADSGVEFDPLRDKSYRLTRLGGPIVDHLASKETAGRSDETLDAKERCLAEFALKYPKLRVDQVEARHIEHFLAKKTWGWEKRRTQRSHLNQFLTWSMKRRLIVRNPIDDLDTPARKSQKTYDLFSDAEIAALTGLPALDGTLMLVMFDAGLRRGECLALQPRHILPEPIPGQLRIIGGKGDKDRIVDLTKRLSRSLAEYQFVEGMGLKDHFWYTKPGGKSIRRSVQAGEASFHIWWVRCLDQADVRYRNPHMTRHTFATRWLRRGGRLETLKQIMGHESIRTTSDLYGHIDTRDVRRDLEIVEG